MDKKNPDKIESFLIGNKNANITPNPKNNIYIDSYNFLINTFFSNSELDYNHVAIKPDGTYQIFLGKFDIMFILDWSV